MRTNNQEEMEIDIMALFTKVKSKLWILLVTGMIFAAGAGLASKFFMTPQYQSTSKLYVVNKSLSLPSLSLSDLQLGSQLTKDYMVLVKSRPVTEQVIKNLRLTMTHEGLLGIMSINNPTDTRILEITIQYPDAYIAKQIVDEVASVSAKRMAVIMDMKEPSVVEEGHVASNPVSPNVKKNAILAGGLGVVLVTAVICVTYLLDDTIKSCEDVANYLGLITIGVIPTQENILPVNGNIYKKRQRVEARKRAKSA